MSCESFRDRVFDFLEGSLADRAGFDAHRAACPRCADVLRGIRENEKILRAARVPSAPADLWARIATAVARPAPVRRFPLGPWAAAAVLLLGLVALVARPAARPALEVTFVEAREAGGLAAFVPRYEPAERNE
ncbi:MAG TPA: hypothetical protein VF950_04590 [Planctomycetota bacterium]